MDPFNALSIAACVVQFVDFTSKILSKTYELYHSGSSIENAEYETVTTDLRGLSERLINRSSSRGSLAKEEFALETICRGCTVTADELLEKLEGIKLKGKHTKWKSLRQALKSVWSESAIDDISRRLARYRQELDTHLLVLIKEQVEWTSVQHDARFDLLDQSTKDIAQAILDGQDAFAKDLERQTEILELLGTQEHEKTRDFILQTLESLNLQGGGPITGSANAANTRFEMLSEAEVEDKILRNLRYATMQDRLDGVLSAHRKTFEWVFNNPSKTGPGSDFADWLQDGDGIYWVNGKAGSGKSTLFRYLYYHEKSKECLRSWACNMPLDIEGFFFWNSGVVDQRSQSGLLRSLLWQLLSKHKSHIRNCFIDEWSARETLQVGSSDFTWSLIDLQRATRRLIHRMTLRGKLCLYIDGLDEYDGQYSDIIELLQEFAALPNIKLCLSSRPLLVFENAFAEFPSLRLQDLTQADITLFVRDNLQNNPQMLELMSEEPKAAANLIKEIVTKADGVFLWVRLVVKSLLDGLRDGDHTSDLQRRLNNTPPDLESLYQFMLGRMEPHHAIQASEIFQIVSSHYNGPLAFEQLSLLQLSFADAVDIETVVKAPFKRLSDAEKMSKCNRMRRRLQSRCVGLLEVHDAPPESYTARMFQRKLGTDHVDYIHRTARDFLERPEVWSNIIKHTANSAFEPPINLLASDILIVKSQMLPPQTVESESDQTPILLAAAMVHARSVSSSRGERLELLMDELELAIGRWATANPSKIVFGVFNKDYWSYMSDRWDFRYMRNCWVNHRDPEHDDTCTRHDTFLSMAVQAGVTSFVRAKVSKSHRQVKYGRPLLDYTIDKRRIVKFPELMGVLLECGANPNEIFGGHTIWSRLLHVVLQRSEYLSRQAMLDLNVPEVLRLFLQYGADPNLPIGAWGQELTAREVMEHFENWAKKNGPKPMRNAPTIDTRGKEWSLIKYPNDPTVTIRPFPPSRGWYTLPLALQVTGKTRPKSSVRVIDGLHELDGRDIPRVVVRATVRGCISVDSGTDNLPPKEFVDSDSDSLYKRFMEIKRLSGAFHGWKPYPTWYTPLYRPGSGKGTTIDGCFELSAGQFPLPIRGYFGSNLALQTTTIPRRVRTPDISIEHRFKSSAASSPTTVATRPATTSPASIMSRPPEPTQTPLSSINGERPSPSRTFQIDRNKLESPEPPSRHSTPKITFNEILGDLSRPSPDEPGASSSVAAKEKRPHKAKGIFRRLGHRSTSSESPSSF